MEERKIFYIASENSLKMKDLIQIASKEINVRETAGTDITPRIREYAEKAGFDWYTSDETPWCSVFLNWAATEAGLERSKDARAASWEHIGVATDYPEPGDIALFSPSISETRITHVGIFTGYSADKQRIYVLGGNQNNEVNISAFSALTLVGFRRLRPEGGAQVPSLTNRPDAVFLRRGDRGPEVAELQDALKVLGYRPGTSDGVYGYLTESAIRAFQRSEEGLEITGIYDLSTRERMELRLAAEQKNG